MDGGSITNLRAGGSRSAQIPGASFGEAPLPSRALDPGMGVAVARRTVLRPEDEGSFGRVADRVAAGNMALLGPEARAEAEAEAEIERARLRNAIATGALITSGRHLQHGDLDQPGRNMEVFTNCATAIASFAKFYLLLNGSGVGRAYDDALMAVDWADAPALLLHLSPDHPDFPGTPEGLRRFGIEVGVLPWDAPSLGAAEEAAVRAFMARELLAMWRMPPKTPCTTGSRIAARAGRRRSRSWRQWPSAASGTAPWCSIFRWFVRRAAPSGVCRGGRLPVRSR